MVGVALSRVGLATHTPGSETGERREVATKPPSRIAANSLLGGAKSNGSCMGSYPAHISGSRQRQRGR
jgi:hypothetical protein